MELHRTGHGLTRHQRQAARGTTAALHRLSAATYAAAEATAHRTRRTSSLARDRAIRAALALRGQTPPSRWRWAGYGLAAGIMLGAAAATILHRIQHPTPPGDDAPHETTTSTLAPAAASARTREAAATAAAKAVAKVRVAAAAAARTIRDTTARTPRTADIPRGDTVPDTIYADTDADTEAGDARTTNETALDNPAPDNPDAPTPRTRRRRQ